MNSNYHNNIRIFPNFKLPRQINKLRSNYRNLKMNNKLSDQNEFSLQLFLFPALTQDRLSLLRYFLISTRNCFFNIFT